MLDREKTSTLEDFISKQTDNEISYDSSSLVENLDGIDFPIMNIFTSTYVSDLDELTVVLELTDEELMQYQYKPKLLADKIYGNPDYYFILLALNDIANVKDFNFNNVKVLRSADIESIITEIYDQEKEYLDTYREEHA